MGPKKRKKIKQHENKKPPASFILSPNLPKTATVDATNGGGDNVITAFEDNNLSTRKTNNKNSTISQKSDSSIKTNHETLFKFIEAGGKKCYELFQYLSTSAHWRKYGTLPPLSDEEAAMLNHMYQLWLQNQESHDHVEDSHEMYGSPLENEENQNQNEIDDEDEDCDDDVDNDEDVDHENENENDHDEEEDHDEDEDEYEDSESSLDDSQELSIGTCLTTIKETMTTRTQYSDSLLTLLTQLDLLLKSPEPTRTQAGDLLEILMLPEFLERDIESLERMFSSSETHQGYISACILAMGLLVESEHLILPSIPSYETYKERRNTTISPDQYYNSIALSYYLKSNVISSQISAVMPHHPKVEMTQNSIACMLLGSLFLRGGIVDIFSDQELNDEKRIETTSSIPNIQAAFDYYKLAAMGHNPIAQHKVGYFYDEGLPNGVCNVDIMEAVKWYSSAAELMPDSMHNLAKIYEDGRGGFEPDMTQAVTLYSVAAASGFPLSQVNLGRLFLLGEDGVTRDREAGKRLLTLAAESGDADAQMVVGMIHATPAFECYDLKLSEHWLRQSLAGGKLDAERLLVRVCQQMAQQQQQQQQQQQSSQDSQSESNPQDPDVLIESQDNSSNTSAPLPISQNALAAKRRGDDFVCHGLLHAAVLEFSRAFELDRTNLSYFVDRLDILCILGHFEECLTDSSLLLLCVDSNGLEYNPPHHPNGSKSLSNSHSHSHHQQQRQKRHQSQYQRRKNFHIARKKEIDFFRVGLQSSVNTETEILHVKLFELQEAMRRLYDILVESLGSLFSSSSFPLHDPFSFSRLTHNTSAGNGMSSADTGGLLDSYNSLYDQTILSPTSELWPLQTPITGNDENGKHIQNNNLFDVNYDQDDDNRQQYQQLAEDYMFNLHQHHREPVICLLLQDCMERELETTKSSAFLARLTTYDRYYTGAVIRSGGIPILLSALTYPPQLKTADQEGTSTTSSSSSETTLNDAAIKQHILHEQLWLNCAVILHNLSFSHMAKKVMHLLSATDGFPIMCNCLRLCRDKILSLSSLTPISTSSSSSSSPSSSPSMSLVFRMIALARTSTTITQILLSSACLGKEEIWDELMVSDLIGGLLAALESAIYASQIEMYQERMNYLQSLQQIQTSSTNFTTKKLQNILMIRESCLDEGDRILMDTIHTLARLLKIAPSFVLTTASGLLMIPFQRILVAITAHPNNSDQIHESLKSATAFCLCKLLCARDPRNAEILQQSLSKDGIRDILMTKQHYNNTNDTTAMTTITSTTTNATLNNTNTELKQTSHPSQISKQVHPELKSHHTIPLAPPPPPPPSSSKISTGGKKKKSR